MSIRIDWTNFVQQITDSDGSNPRDMNWNIPHSVYKDTSPINISNAGLPRAVLESNEFDYVDNDVHFDTTYYYRLSELLPGGEYFTEEVKVHIKRHILTFEAPYLATMLYRNSKSDRIGNLIPVDMLDLTIRDENDEPVEVIQPDWYWNGEGRISEWLEFIVNDETIAIRRRGNYTQNLKSVVVRKDRRNYPAAEIYTTPVLSNSVFLGASNPVDTPYWWADYHAQVNDENPDSWHNFWISRFGTWSDTQTWYEADWVNDPNIARYDSRVFNSMHGPYQTEELEQGPTDIVLRARIGVDFVNGQYTGQYFDTTTNTWENGTINGVPRPGNMAQVGWGATITFMKIRGRIDMSSVFSFEFDGTTYEIEMTNLNGVATGDDEVLASAIQDEINSKIGSLPDDAPEPHITVSLYP